MNCRTVQEREIIIRYLKEELDTDEKKSFEEHYFNCDTCFSELSLQHTAGVRLKALGSERASEPPFFQKSFPIAASLVIGLLLLSALMWFYTGGHEKPSRQELIAELSAVEEVPAFPQVVLRDSERDSIIRTRKEAVEFYNEGRYQEAIPLFQRLQEQDLQDLSWSFYLGVCLLMTEDNRGAVDAFSAVLEKGGGAFTELSHWYLYKAYLRQGRFIEARNHLEHVVSLEGALQARALRDLKEVQQIRGH